MSAAEFAAATSMSLTAVRSLIARGDLHAVRLGRSVRIPVSEFARLGLDPPVLDDGEPAER